MYAIELGTKELEEIKIFLAGEINPSCKGLIIIQRIFSGETFTCFCKMHGGGSLKIAAGANLHFVSRFIMNLRLQNEKGALLTIPENSEERRIPVEDLSEPEILLLAAAEKRGKESFSFGCLDGKGKVEITSPLEIAFMLRGKWEDYMGLVGKKNYYKEVLV